VRKRYVIVGRKSAKSPTDMTPGDVLSPMIIATPRGASASATSAKATCTKTTLNDFGLRSPSRT
jgi:hypothetical protein